MDPLAELIGAVVDRRQPWRADAACLEHPELDWLPDRGTSITAQRAVCSSCLVREECMTYAMGLGATLPGVWGGTSARERRELRRRGEAAA